MLERYNDDSSNNTTHKRRFEMDKYKKEHEQSIAEYIVIPLIATLVSMARQKKVRKALI